MKVHFVKQLFYKNYYLDSRSLVLFRIYIALTLLVSLLFTRLPFFELFHSEKGLLPLQDLVQHFGFMSKTMSLNLIYAGDSFQIFLFGLAILCAFFLLIGYHTRWTLFGAWILSASLYTKNPIVNGGDNVLILILFWSLLLPLNSHVSMDKVGEKKVKPFSVYSITSFCFIGQVLMIYIFAWISKTDITWKDGSAVYYALMLDNFRTKWGDILLQYPQVIKISTWLTYYFFELSVPWLFILFGWLWRVRIILIFLMISFHLSLSLFLDLGLFSWFCISGWLVLLPSEFWNRLNKYLSLTQKKLESVSFFQTKIHNFIVYSKTSLNKIFPVHQQQLSVHSSVHSSSYSFCRNKLVPGVLKIFFGLCFLYVLAWNVRNLNYAKYSKYFPASWNGLGQALHLHQQWNMFAPRPPHESGWIILSATPEQPKINYPLESEISKQCPTEPKSIKIDLWQEGRPVTMNKPHRYNDTFPNLRYRKLIEYLIFYSKNKPHQKKYLQYRCRKWNKKHPDNKVTDIELIHLVVTIPPPGGKAGKPKAQNMEKVKCRL